MGDKTVDENMAKDPHYAPYCLKCDSSLNWDGRMQRVSPTRAECPRCDAVYDQEESEFKIWDGAYRKRWYDVRTPDGTVYHNCWPNAGKMCFVGEGLSWEPGEIEVKLSERHPATQPTYTGETRTAATFVAMASAAVGATITGSYNRHSSADYRHDPNRRKTDADVEKIQAAEVRRERRRQKKQEALERKEHRDNIGRV